MHLKSNECFRLFARLSFYIPDQTRHDCESVNRYVRSVSTSRCSSVLFLTVWTKLMRFYCILLQFIPIKINQSQQ